MSAPKPANWAELTRTWNDPIGWARERARYYEQLRAEGVIDSGRDLTEPIKGSR